MDIFDKRDILLDRQGSMLEGKVEKDNEFLSLIVFENWCVNSGLSGFAQLIADYDIESISAFAERNNLDTVDKMTSILNMFIEKYGLDFDDHLNEEEYKELSQFDDDFQDIHDQYTEALYSEYIK